MATEEFYRDEHPKPSEGGWGVEGLPWVPPGGWYPEGPVVAIPPPSGFPWLPPPAEDAPWFLIGSWGDEGDQLIIVDGEGTALTNGLELLKGPCCMKIEIECQIKDYPTGSDGRFFHIDCILLGAVPRKSENGNNSIFASLLKNGEIDIYARWQKGHYNHASIHTVRFRLNERNETVTPWYKIPMGNAPGKRVMTLVVKDGILTTKSAG